MIERAAAVLTAVRGFVADPQFPAVAVTALLVTAGVLWGRRWYLGRTNGQSHGLLADAFAVVVPYLAGLLILGLALFAAAGEPRPWYETAARLLALLALIRLATFLVRLSLGKSRTIKSWELRVTLVVWAFIAAEVLSFATVQEHGTVRKAEIKAKPRLEGKEYVVQDGDVMHFKFNKSR